MVQSLYLHAQFQFSSSSGNACTQEKDRGSCRDFTVKWFFDTEYGGCSRFWYGGCDGNNNRFKSQEECKAVCIEPPGREACFLPKIEGPCEGYYPTWHYDAERKQCRQFIYGGCLGNNNKFQTREECDELCVTPDTIDACDQPRFEGPCRGNFSRWYFDKESGICSEFSYGGCKGNGNNFYTESACHQQCLQPGRSRAVMDVCALPKDMGPCPGAILRWHYDAIQQTCKQFVYGGCQGNGNRFRTEEDCRTKCHVSATARDHCALPRAQGNCTERLPRWFFDAEENRCMPFYYTGCEGNANRFETQEACETDCPPKVEQDTCTLPAMVGECHNYTERWYYDSFEVRCRPFYYGGCGGNHNNFPNMQDCQQRCEAGYNTPEPPEQFKTEYCFLPDDHGPCSESVAHWFYDSRDGVCKQFLYGGCQGNQNRFASRQDCEQNCGNVQDKCILPRVVGPCSGSIQQWYYEQHSDSCEEFDYGGCQGNANRFNDRQECEESCKRGVPEITTAGPRVLEPKTDNSLSVFQPVDICLTHVDPGPCRGQNSAWYFDYSSLSCQAFVYGGCGGNANRFESEEQCERQCGIFKGQDVCTMPYEIGPCRGLFRKWYFDSTSGNCQEFDYGGCSGNGNRFSSISECESICLHREELLPTGDDTSLSHQAVCRLPVETGPCEGGYYKRWYFNQDHRTCIPFIYSGCAGNLNRFKNFQTCLNFCSVMLQEGGSGEPDDSQGQRKCTERVASDANEIDVDSPREKADGLCAEAREECNKLHCPYRVEKFVDSSDCERCRCHDPCREQYCPEGSLCAVDLYHNDETSQTEFRAICRQDSPLLFLLPVNKPGSCPRLTPITGNCIEECTTDADCVEDFKCCFNGCGSSCVHSLAPEAQILTTLPSTSQPTEAQTQTMARGEVPPSIVDTEPVLTAEEGSQATLRCIATGSPTPSISWRKDRLTITGSNGRTKILLDGSLQIIGLQRSDAGVYICFADNGIGQPSYKEITLDITGGFKPPKPPPGYGLGQRL
uniref:Papilin n=1 Tax=Timema genevievae TaxID=629358 RepID=A0A7R9PJ02_TIMGE|nr:unnamed protein product [Timema genevievae]